MPTADFGAGVTGLGKCIPSRRITTEFLAKKLGITPDWILNRTGIQSRYFVGEKETASLISAKSAGQALRRAGVKSDALQLIIGCTTSGDYVFPALASKVQHLLKAEHAGAFDLSASASSFSVALQIAADRLGCDPLAKNILIVGTAVQSPYIHWKSRELAVLLGDASAAVVVSRLPKGYGILASATISHGSIYDAARLRGGGSRFPMRPDNVGRSLQYIEMNGVLMGREFLKHQPVMIQNALTRSGLKTSDVRLFLFHQANLRLIQILMERMKLPMDKTFTTVERLGNTAEASLPISLCEAHEKGLIKRGDIVVMSGVGAGCILSVTVMKWY